MEPCGLPGFNTDETMEKYLKDVYSQNGEDGIIDEIINRVGSIPKYFVEFGAWDGFHCSNAANLRENKGWDGVMFELDGNKVLENKNENIKLYDQAITSENINQVFKDHNVPSSFGLLSIDIDVDDWYVWKALNKKYKPFIVVIEYNYHLDNAEPMVYVEQGLNQTRSNVHHNYFNSNLLAMCELGISKGYIVAAVVNCNIIFVRKDLQNKVGIEPLSARGVVKKYESKDLCVEREYKTEKIKHSREWAK